MGLDLYSKVEPYLGFEDEVKQLHDVFKQIVEETEAKSLLDVGCGQGEFMQMFDDVNVKGVDLSSHQIEVCKQKGLNAQCINLFDMNEKFDTITATFDVLNYVPKDELGDFVQKITECLNDGGYFVFDVNSKFAFEDIVTGSIVIDKDDRFITIDALYEEPKLNTQITQFLSDEDGKFTKEKDSITQFYHSKEFLKKVLKKAGFDVEAMRDYFLYGFDMADKLIFICKKV